MGAGDEREEAEVCIWQLGRHKGKQTILFAEKPLSCCTMNACYYWPGLSILLHKRRNLFPQNSTLPYTDGIGSAAALLCIIDNLRKDSWDCV